MMFSKSRTNLSGWFDPVYNGEWGAEDADFASRCYHSGMRLRHEAGLQAYHQQHGRSRLPSEQNRRRWKQRMKIYQMMLDFVTGYRPKWVIFVYLKEHSHNLDRHMQRIFRGITPVKVCIINEDSNVSFKYWRLRWAVDHVNVDGPLVKTLPRIREYYESKGYRCIDK